MAKLTQGSPARIFGQTQGGNSPPPPPRSHLARLCRLTLYSRAAVTPLYKILRTPLSLYLNGTFSSASCAWAYAAFGKGGVEILYKVTLRHAKLCDSADSTSGGGGGCCPPSADSTSGGGGERVYQPPLMAHLVPSLCRYYM